MLRLSNRLVILLVIFLTGCTAKYNIKINNEKDIFESLDIIENDESKFDEKTEYLYDSTPREYLETDVKWPTPVYDNSINPLEPVKLDNVKYYNKKDNSKKEMLNINYNYKHKIDNYKTAKIINKCYEFELKHNNNIIDFKTVSDFKCFEEYKMLDNVEFNLNSSCIVTGNFDSKEKHNYLWNIKDNINKKIEFKIDCNKKEEQKKRRIAYITYIGYTILFIFILVLIRIIYRINSKL